MQAGSTSPVASSRARRDFRRDDANDAAARTRRWLWSGGIPTSTQGGPRPKIPQKRPRPIEAVGVDLVLAQTPDERGRMCVLLLYGPALRCMEVCGLRVEGNRLV